jgi:enoyl-CoA hydratase/carnithine racemase
MDMILTSRRDNVCTVTLNRPDKRNALSVALIDQLGRTIETLSADRTMRVLLIRGTGQAFCAGLDLGELAEPDMLGQLDGALIDKVLEPLQACPRPTIAVVQGDAIAGGCELALHCDLRVASSDARFAMPVARLGLAAPYPLTLKLVETIGAAATKELLFTGDFITADRALSLGMITRLTQPADLEASAWALAETIAANAPIALEAMKQYALRARHMFTAIPHDDLVVQARRVRDSADVREGLRARRERRKPVFRGE